VGDESGPQPTGGDGTPIVGVFPDYALARDAILGLEAAGIEQEAISVLARTPGEARSLDDETGASRDLEGVTSSHRVHDVLDWLASIGGALPGFGPVAGTGNLGLQVARANSSEDRGAVTGALVGLGVSVDEAERYEEQVLAGQILVVVHGTADPSAARSALWPT
jgi:Heat induced stress protein YflT